MKKSLLALAVVGVLASTGATAANGVDPGNSAMTTVQYRDHDYRYREGYDRPQNIYERGVQMRNRIERAASEGRIDEWEARRLERELAQFEEKERYFNRDRRISQGEAAELDRDLDRLAYDLRRQIRD